MRLIPLLVGALLAQDPGPRPTFTSRSDLVVLRVSVVDRHAGFVANLPRDAFVVRENGRARPIAVFNRNDTPATVGLVIDNSGSMAPRREAVIQAGSAFAHSSHPADELFTINFNERVWPGLAPSQPFTSDHDVLHAALERAIARGQTAMFDAMLAALTYLERGTQPRRVLILVGDGGDNASRASFADVLEAALRRDVVIYTVGLADRDDPEARPKRLRELADVTGGEAFFPRNNHEIGPVFQRIARDIRSSYMIGYDPLAATTAGGGGRRKVEVDLQGRDYRKFTVRARSVYIPREDGHARQ